MLNAGEAELERIIDGQVRRWVIQVIANAQPAMLVSFCFCDG